MTFISRYLKGEFGLLKTFWLGLVLFGALLTLISHEVEDYVWLAYSYDDGSWAVGLQSLIVIIQLILMGVAVAVIFASFYNKQPDAKGWAASAVAVIIMLSCVANIIETTTSIRHEGQSYGWPMGRDHRSFGQFGFAHHFIQEALEEGRIHAISLQIATIYDKTDPPLDEASGEQDSEVTVALCRHLFFVRHPLFKYAIIDIKRNTGTPTRLLISKDDC